MITSNTMLKLIGSKRYTKSKDDVTSASTVDELTAKMINGKDRL
jgi:hypothetical protein